MRNFSISESLIARKITDTESDFVLCRKLIQFRSVVILIRLKKKYVVSSYNDWKIFDLNYIDEKTVQIANFKNPSLNRINPRCSNF
jgi:hypothetical protein